MATAHVSKPTLFKWFHNKSFMLSIHRFHHHSKFDLSLRVSKTKMATLNAPPKREPCPPPKREPCPPEGDTQIIPPNCKEQERKEELQQIFRHFDADGNGIISGAELRCYLASIKEFMSAEEAKAVIDDLESAGGDNLTLDFDTFVKLMVREAGEEDLRRTFEMFVVEKGSGVIKPEGLHRMFNCLGYKVSEEECKKIILAFDCDGDGMLGFSEFQQMMAA